MKHTFIFIILYLICGYAQSDDYSIIKTVLFPFREAVISSSVGSSITKYQFKIGENFSKDDVIVRLDDALYKLEYNRASEKYDFAKSNYEDKVKLFEKKFTSDIELKRALFEMKIALIQRDEAELQYSFCTIKAPFAGKIIEIFTNEHEVVRIGQNLFKIIDDSQLLAVMNVPTNIDNLIKIGEKVQIKMDNETIISGKIYEVSPQADHRTGTQKVRVLINNRDGALTAGTIGTLYNGK